MITKPLYLAALLLCLTVPCSAATTQPERINPHFPSVDLRETVRPTALVPLDRGGAQITGRVRDQAQGHVLVRVTDGAGTSVHALFAVHDGVFHAEYPRQFPGAPAWKPCVLFVDATTGPAFNPADPQNRPAEVTLLVYDRRRHTVPDYPSAFTTDLRDQRGQSDKTAVEWPATRALVNLYMHSYGAFVAGVARPDFDLSHPGDLTYFKNSLALYDFDHRDRDWASPLGNRPARTFWKSVWSTWFNASNDHPLDNNPANGTSANYLPYMFTNDFADILIEQLMRRGLTGSTQDDLDTMCREGAENLLACQHQEETNFALADTAGHRETYTAGAFRYGLFVNGDYMTEGKGWFYNPAFRDYADGGVLNGRALWAIGEALRRGPKGTITPRLKAAMALGVQFCLHDALQTGYAKRTPQGHVYWRDAGENAYLALGMVDGCAVVPDMIVRRPKAELPVTLRAACADALNALVDLERPHGQWAVYPNVDSVAISALSEGALVLKDDPDAGRWRAAAQKAADGWMGARIDPAEFRGPVVHFGLRLTPDTMTYRWAKLDSRSWQNHNYIFFYQTGHWIEALSHLYALTGEPQYRKRAEAMVAYLCGDNPWGVRLLNETGGVYNWVEDSDGDGIEDTLRQDMYPESTAFTLIGLYHLMQSVAAPESAAKEKRMTAESRHASTDWFSKSRRGAFMHFLPGSDASLLEVDKFDVDALATQLQQIGAKYFVITLGQNSGYFNSPNAAYDRITGYKPGERCSKRDLPLDLYKALKPKGIRLMLYLPAQVPNRDTRAQAAFGLQVGPADQPIDAAFAQKWAQVIQEWSDRYGDKVSGWWFDGCYQHVHFNDQIAEIYNRAVKHGNPRSIAAFNPGVQVIHYSQFEDYTAGELNEPFDQIPATRFLDGSQWHALTFMGSSWAQRDTRYTGEQWATWIQKVVAHGGVVTLDMGPNWDEKAGPIGSLAADQVAEAIVIKNALP